MAFENGKKTGKRKLREIEAKGKDD